MIYLHHDLKAYFSEQKNLFDQVMMLEGECFRHEKGRKTQKIILGNTPYFIKQHQGVGWKEIIKNLTQLKWPVVSARNEWQALQRCRDLKIDAPALMGYGSRGTNPACIQSFVLMEALTGTISLEDLCREWKTKPPSFAFKKKLITEVARIARTLHENGINHRDFYICHFLFHPESLKLYLIDLHRAQIRAKVPERWKIKDLAGLYFSSKDIGLSKRDYYRFMQVYRQLPVKDILRNERHFWEKVRKRGEELYHEHA